MNKVILSITAIAMFPLLFLAQGRQREWGAYGGTAEQTRYSTLQQINRDRKFRAFDKTTGRLLWETTLPFAGNATPATYEAGGRQFIVIAAGGGQNRRTPSGGVYVAFALPERTK